MGFLSKIRTSATYFGTVGIYIFLASLMCKSPIQTKTLDMIENHVLAVYFTLNSYLFLFLNSGSSLSTAFAIVNGFISLSFLNGLYKRFSLMAAIFMTLFVDLFINNLDVSFWTQKHSIHFWMQISLICDNICIVLGLTYMYLFETFKGLRTVNL
jgi:hypothetical protein